MSGIKALENHVSALKDLISKREMALKLSENREFRKLFIEGFCRDEAARLIAMSTDPRIDAKIAASCVQEAQAAGFVKRYLSDMITMGLKAQNDLVETLEQLEELRAQPDADVEGDQL